MNDQHNTGFFFGANKNLSNFFGYLCFRWKFLFLVLYQISQTTDGLLLYLCLMSPCGCVSPPWILLWTQLDWFYTKNVWFCFNYPYYQEYWLLSRYIFYNICFFLTCIFVKCCFFPRLEYFLIAVYIGYKKVCFLHLLSRNHWNIQVLTWFEFVKILWLNISQQVTKCALNVEKIRLYVKSTKILINYFILYLDNIKQGFLQIGLYKF